MKNDSIPVVPFQVSIPGLHAVNRPPIVEPPQPGKVGGESIRNTVASHVADPQHRFHQSKAGRDARRAIAASEAVQRIRGRHFGGSLRAPRKGAS